MNEKEFQRKLYGGSKTPLTIAGNTAVKKVTKPVQKIKPKENLIIAPEGFVNVPDHIISIVNEPLMPEIGALESAITNYKKTEGKFNIPYESPIGYGIKHVAEREVGRFLKMLGKVHIGTSIYRGKIPDLTNLSGETIGFPQFLEYLNYFRFDSELTKEKNEEIRRVEPSLILNGSVILKEIERIKEIYSIKFNYNIENKISGNLILSLSLSRKSRTIDVKNDLFIKKPEEKTDYPVYSKTPDWATPEYHEKYMKELKSRFK